ncbi:hypothetical protein [Amycolatopsis taiwanensis]|uniref:hypothetical protein n=1 Tax=Amycolatopsis taiwanensis TaxID=342230 RepID=UPI000487AA50|nr:hypothetical protein [Amycolatopsis taiwanensis]
MTARIPDPKGYQWFRYGPYDPPYRKTPEGEYHQFRPQYNGWCYCNQNERGLTRIPFSKLPAELKARAIEKALPRPVVDVQLPEPIGSEA